MNCFGPDNNALTSGRSLNAQTEGSLALQHFEDMCRAFMTSRESFNYMKNFFANMRRKAARRKLDKIVEELVKERFDIVRRESFLNRSHHTQTHSFTSIEAR